VAAWLLQRQSAALSTRCARTGFRAMYLAVATKWRSESTGSLQNRLSNT
jgi:hypothetical protein